MISLGLSYVSFFLLFSIFKQFFKATNSEYLGQRACQEKASRWAITASTMHGRLQTSLQQHQVSVIRVQLRLGQSSNNEDLSQSFIFYFLTLILRLSLLEAEDGEVERVGLQSFANEQGLVTTAFILLFVSQFVGIKLCQSMAMLLHKAVVKAMQLRKAVLKAKIKLSISTKKETHR